MAKVNRQDGRLIAQESTTDYNDATMIKTGADGQFEIIYKVPIWTDGNRDVKRIYEIYEVYIPKTETGDSLGDILTIDDHTGYYKQLWDINDESIVRNVDIKDDGIIDRIINLETITAYNNIDEIFSQNDSLFYAGRI